MDYPGIEELEQENRLLRARNDRLEAQLNKKRLTDEEFFDIIMRKGSVELVGHLTFRNHSIQGQGNLQLLHSAKVIKQFIEDIYDVGESKQ